MRKPESNNQVFFIDASGALCSRSSGHAIDVESTFTLCLFTKRPTLIIPADEQLVLRHRRPVSHPFPNAYSHPLPRFSYDASSSRITVTFAFDPSYPATSGREAALSTWKDKAYLLTSIPMRKPRTIMDDASAILSSAISAPFSLISGRGVKTSPQPDDVFSSGDIDLREDEILEQERSEEGEVDNSPERYRSVRVIGVGKEDDRVLGENASARQQWVIIPLRSTRNRRLPPQ